MREQRSGINKFFITVEDRQNATWQGSVTMLDQDKTIHFRSALELIKLMDETVCNKQR